MPSRGRIYRRHEGPAVTQAGDLWLLGRHKLIRGDARKAGAYAALLGDAFVVAQQTAKDAAVHTLQTRQALRKTANTLVPSTSRAHIMSAAARIETFSARECQRGRISKEPLALYEAGTVTLCSQPKSSPF